MSLIMLPIATETAKSGHDYCAVSSQGRRIMISVEAEPDASEAQVQQDLSASLSLACAATLCRSDSGRTGNPFTAVLFAFMAWGLTLAIGSVLILLLDESGARLLPPNAWLFPEAWPSFFAGETVGTVLLRCHIALLVPVLMATYYVCSRRGRIHHS